MLTVCNKSSLNSPPHSISLQPSGHISNEPISSPTNQLLSVLLTQCLMGKRYMLAQQDCINLPFEDQL